jgi:phosphate transport system substrate-binding protein
MMRPIFKQIILFSVLAIFLMISCKPSGSKKINKETPTNGDIKIAVDESYQLIAGSEIAVFENLYKNANINPINASEDSILKLFFADSVRLMITSRKLTENEEAYLKENLIVPRTTHIAWDAVAFLVNRSNPDSLIRYNIIQDILKGNISNWKKVNSKSKLGDIEVVFDNQGSGNIRYLMKKFGITTLPGYCYSSNSNPAVVEYVENHPGSLGIISVNWVSDTADSITHAFLRRAKVVGISEEFNSEGGDFYQPHPAYIADKSYPFIREVYAISREPIIGLGRGFIQFVAGEVGQRIILRSGMLPATMPIRLIQISKE